MEILGLEPALFTFLVALVGLGVAVLTIVAMMYFNHRSDMREMRSEFRDDMNAMRAGMDAMRSVFMSRFDALDSRMDAQRTEFKTEMSERFDAVDSRMDAQRTEFREDMNAQRTEIMSRFDAVDSRMDAQRTELRAEMSEIGARLDVINTDMGDMKTEVALIRQKLEHVEWRLARLETQAGIPQNGADDADAAARIAANGDLRREFDALKARMAALEAREETA